MFEEITLETYDTAIEVARNNETFRDMTSAKFSMIYCIATALKKGSLTMFDFDEEELEDSEIRRLASSVRIIINQEFNNMFPKRWLAKVKITKKSGVCEEVVEYPKGEPVFVK